MIEIHYKQNDNSQDSVVRFEGVEKQEVSIYYLKSMSENCLGVYIDGRNCGCGDKFSGFCKDVYDIFFPAYEKIEKNKSANLELIKKYSNELVLKKDSINILGV